jgi:hypothetical protein
MVKLLAFSNQPKKIEVVLGERLSGIPQPCVPAES